MGFINTYELKNKKKILISLLIGIIYAISDEIHQMFSDGRTTTILDVFIDSCGVLFGIGIFMIFCKIANAKKDRILL